MTGIGAAVLKGDENIGIDDSSQVNSTFDPIWRGGVFFTAVFFLIVEARESQVCLLWSGEVAF
jgi:hypothetical protein